MLGIYGPLCGWLNVPLFTTSLDSIRAEVMKLHHLKGDQFESELTKRMMEKKCHFHQLTATDWTITFLHIKNPSKLEEILKV